MATKADRERDSRIREFCERLVSHGFTGKERGAFYQYVKEVSGVKALVEVRRAEKGNLFDNVYVALHYVSESGSNEVRVHSSILRTADPSVQDADTEEEAERHRVPSTLAVVKLEIPADAKRVSYGGNVPDVKCRASKAKVLSIRSVERSKKTHRTVAFKEASSMFNDSFVYRVGEVVRPAHRFCDSLLEECASGIHHFMTKREAIDYSK